MLAVSEHKSSASLISLQKNMAFLLVIIWLLLFKIAVSLADLLRLTASRGFSPIFLLSCISVGNQSFMTPQMLILSQKNLNIEDITHFISSEIHVMVNVL
jgi:hypothetical protein